MPLSVRKNVFHLLNISGSHKIEDLEREQEAKAKKFRQYNLFNGDAATAPERWMKYVKEQRRLRGLEKNNIFNESRNNTSMKKVVEQPSLKNKNLLGMKEDERKNKPQQQKQQVKQQERPTTNTTTSGEQVALGEERHLVKKRSLLSDKNKKRLSDNSISIEGSEIQLRSES